MQKVLKSLRVCRVSSVHVNGLAHLAFIKHLRVSSSFDWEETGLRGTDAALAILHSIDNLCILLQLSNLVSGDDCPIELALKLLLLLIRVFQTDLAHYRESRFMKDRGLKANIRNLGKN